MGRRRSGPMGLARRFMRAADQELGRPSSRDRLEQRIEVIDRHHRRRLNASTALVVGLPLMMLVFLCMVAVQLL